MKKINTLFDEKVHITSRYVVHLHNHRNNRLSSLPT
jgi:hypothetical protein